ncbi:MAG TPA: hypothetical protein VEZ55_10850, partial [Chitinophagaceae bacterium]|nr:hypothetical protein [Chitinophagaceae bacterium]
MIDWIFIGILCSILFSLSCQSKKNKSTPVAEIKEAVQQKIDSIEHWYNNEWLPIASGGTEAQMHRAFGNGRKIYKQIEWAVEFFFPQTAKELNGAPLPEIEPEENMVIAPSGFQVIEALIYPFAETNRTRLLQESKKLTSVLHRLQILWHEHQFRDDQVFVACRLQVMRITSLSLAGFDTPLSLTAIQEVSFSLKGVQTAISAYEQVQHLQLFDSIYTMIRGAADFISEHKHFESFDRAFFIGSYLQPLANWFFILQYKLNLKPPNIY